MLGSCLAAPDTAGRALSVLAAIAGSAIDGLFAFDFEGYALLIVVVQGSDKRPCQGPDTIWLDLILLLDSVSSNELPISRKIIEKVIEERRVQDTWDLLYKSAYHQSKKVAGSF